MVCKSHSHLVNQALQWASLSFLNHSLSNHECMMTSSLLSSYALDPINVFTVCLWLLAQSKIEMQKCKISHDLNPPIESNLSCDSLTSTDGLECTWLFTFWIWLQMIVYEQATWKTHPVLVDTASCVVCGVSGGSYTLVPHTSMYINTCTHTHTRICAHDTHTQSMHTHTHNTHTQHAHNMLTHYTHTHTHTHTHMHTTCNTCKHTHMHDTHIHMFRYQQYVGHVSYVAFDQSVQGSKRLLVASESGVLAAVNTRTGNISKNTQCQVLHRGIAIIKATEATASIKISLLWVCPHTIHWRH